MTKIKFCGLKTTEDVKNALQQNVDFIGLVFAESKRQLKFEDAKKLSDYLVALGENQTTSNSNNPKKLPLKVGVFKNQDFPEISQAVESANLDFIQLHGDENLDFFTNLKSELGINFRPIIKAIKIQENNDLIQLLQDMNNNQYPVELIPYFLFDAPIPGSGKSFDWSKIDFSLLEQLDRPFFLAGGLNSENVGEGIKLFQPFGVDVSSGIEVEGKKDLSKMQQFIQSVKLS